jgi:putative hydrolase of the HAD superfamily
MIKNIVFDMGNVLAKFDPAFFCASRVKDPKDADLLRREVFGSVEWAMLDRGTITKENAAAAAARRLPSRLRPHAAWLIGHWYDHFKPDKAMEKFIPTLKEKGYRLFLLSNAGYDFYGYRTTLKALEHFDGQLISAEVHLLKPDREIFEALLKKFSLKAGECFFIDDMSANVEAALNLGFRGMVYRGKISKLAAALREAGVTI